jgi:uncharacterized protein (DUF2235 family)
MPKKIVICCDGTGNDFDQVTTESNVIKFYSSLAIDPEQVGYYHPGVGTMGAQNVRWRPAREWSRLKGLAFGAGLLANVADAYRYLMNTYVDGDEIFLFGFSRGSYTARALASVLHIFGLLCAGNDGLIPYILRIYSQRTRAANHKQKSFPPNEVFQWQFSHSHPVTVNFCGLWDTVSSYGWAYSPIKLPFEGNNPIIKKARHAVSIDERRCYYRDNLWGPAEHGQDIRQVWFLGVHSDVGGSYEENESGLSKIALEWMLVEAKKAGVRINHERAETVLGRAAPKPPVTGMPKYAQPDPDAPIHHSLHGAWWILEFLPHRYPDLKGQWTIPLGRRRTIPEGSFIHELALRSKYPPKNLPKQYKVEPHVALAYSSSS